MLGILLLAMVSAWAIAVTLSIHFSLSFLEIIAVYSGTGTALVFACVVAIAFVRRNAQPSAALTPYSCRSGRSDFRGNYRRTDTL